MAGTRDLLRRWPIQALACRVIAGYIRLVRATGRWTIENTEEIRRLIAEGRPFVVCFWHGRLLMIPHAWPSEAPMNVLISHHRDGRLIAGALAHFGIDTISGSTSRGGNAAVLAMFRALKRGEYVSITPDGPRGPRMRASPGVILTAQRTGVPIVPVSFAASRRRVLGSWDRFVLALPFGRGVIRFGDPIEVPATAEADDRERLRTLLEDALNELTRELDARFGLDEIEAAPVSACGPAPGSTLRSAESGR